jgi:methionine synthase II (cobalamin-independent)
MPSDAPHNPPFSADHVARLLRPTELLADAGCRYIQIDETALASLSDRRSWEAMRDCGDDGRKLRLEDYPEIINRAFAKLRL